MSLNLILQGKGGVGKSFVSSVLAQYIDDKKQPSLTLICIDTDPVNSTFIEYKSLNVEKLSILNDNSVNARNFDALIERVVTTPDNIYIVDNGASCFLPLTNYIIGNKIIDLLSDMNITVNIHTIVVGGQSMDDTMTGLKTLLDNISGKAKIYVWANQHFGEIEKNGLNFTEMKVYKENKAKIAGIVVIPKYGELFSEDVQLMLKQHLTFDDVNTSKAGEFSFMEKSRLKIVKDGLYEQLDKIPLDGLQQGKKTKEKSKEQA